MFTINSTHRPDPRQRGGFALVGVVFVLAVLSVGAVLLLNSGSDQVQIGLATQDWVRAGRAADAGIGTLVSEWSSSQFDTLTPSPGDSTDLGWTTIENGARYNVMFRRVDAGMIQRFSARVTGDAGPQHSGRVIKYLDLEVAPWSIDIDAAITGGSERIEQENDAVISGIDTDPSGWSGYCGGPTADRPGVLWHANDLDISDPSLVNGSPVDIEIDTSLNPTNIFEWGDADYDDLVARADITFNGSQDIGSGIRPRLTGSACNTSHNLNWGAPNNPSHACFSYFPIIHFRADARIRDPGAVGQGIMLVDDPNSWALELEENFKFYGIVLVKGEVRIADDVEIHGGIIAGDRTRVELDSQAQYSSCAINRAIFGASLFELKPLSSRSVRAVM